MSGENGPTNREIGTELAVKLVEQLVVANENAQATQKLLSELRDLINDLNGNFDVVGRAMEILHEKRGKKLNLADFAEAWIEAEDEILGEEDEPDQGDPLVGAER